MHSAADITQLKAQLGNLLELRFKDGYAARARLILLDPEASPNELVYDLVEVLSWGSLRPDQIDREAAHASSLADLESWRLVD